MEFVMEFVAMFLIAIGLGTLVFGIWGLVCNYRTFKQRQRLIPHHGDPQFWEKHRAWAAVTYQQHHWCLIRFGNPADLYPAPQSRTPVDDRRMARPASSDWAN